MPPRFERAARAALQASPRGYVLAAPLVLALAGATAAAAQGARSWVDPPAEAAAPREGGAPAPAAPPTAQPTPPQPAPPPSAAAPPAPPPAAPPREAVAPTPPPRSAAPAEPPRLPAPVERAAPRDVAPPVERAEPREAPARPPVQEAERPRPAPRPDPRPESRPEPRARPAVARDFTLDYLDSWSAPNAFALQETSDFYAPRVEFHGREMSARALFEEKRRFVQRWPVRDYRPRRDTMAVACEPDADLCRVRAVFDFLAESPGRGRRSQGTGTLELVLAFEGGRPWIVAERSSLQGRARAGRDVAVEEDDD